MTSSTVRYCFPAKCFHNHQFKATVTHSSNRNQRLVYSNMVLVKQDSIRQFSWPCLLDCLSQLPQQVGIIFPIDSLAFLMVINKHNALCIPEDEGHHFPCQWHHLGFLLRGSRGVFPLHGLSFDLRLKVMDPTLISSEETFIETGCICFKKCQLSSPVTWPAWYAFDQASKPVAHTERKPSPYQVRCAECPLLVLGRCLQH